MNDRQLRSFVSAAEKKSFSKAAAISYISTPALINQINILEKDLGFSLFDRGNHGIELTREGRDFYRSAVEILTAYDLTVDRCRREAVNRRNTIHIAGILGRVTPRAFADAYRYQLEHPDISISFVQMSLDEAYAAMETGEVQVVCAAKPAGGVLPDGCIYRKIARAPLSLLVTANHPLADKEVATKDDINGLRLYWTLSSYHSEYENLLEETGVRLIGSLAFASDAMMYSAMLAGDALVIPADWKIENCPVVKTVRLDLPPIEIGLIYPENAPEYVTDFLESFIDGADYQF